MRHIFLIFHPHPLFVFDLVVGGVDRDIRFSLAAEMNEFAYNSSRKPWWWCICVPQMNSKLWYDSSSSYNKEDVLVYQTDTPCYLISHKFLLMLLLSVLHKQLYTCITIVQNGVSIEKYKYHSGRNFYSEIKLLHWQIFEINMMVGMVDSERDDHKVVSHRTWRSFPEKIMTPTVF